MEIWHLLALPIGLGLYVVGFLHGRVEKRAAGMKTHGYRDNAKPSERPDPPTVVMRNGVAVFHWRGVEYRRACDGSDWTIREWPSLRVPEYDTYRALEDAFDARKQTVALGRADP